jgi:hypothetical protein
VIWKSLFAIDWAVLVDDVDSSVELSSSLAQLKKTAQKIKRITG